MRRLLLVLLLLLFIGALIAMYNYLLNDDEPDREEPAATEVVVETIAENLEAPWSLDFGFNGDIFFTERPGQVRLIRNGELVEEPLLELPGAPAEGGVLGIALDPNFETSRFVYLYYTTEDITNRISRFSYSDLELHEEEILIDDIPGAAIHNGGRLRFGPDGNLYAGTGDANVPELSQDESSLAGKILRLSPDGSIPVDNPDPNSYVYSIGHRNVQGLAWDNEGSLYASEHGPTGHDEINIIEAGGNYGWPEARGRQEHPNFNDPIIDSGNDTWAPSGATFYAHDLLPESWHGRLIFAGLRSQTLWRLDIDTLELESLYDGEYGRLRDVQQAPDGSLYVLTSNRDGRGDPTGSDDRILRITIE